MNQKIIKTMKDVINIYNLVLTQMLRVQKYVGTPAGLRSNVGGKKINSCMINDKAINQSMTIASKHQLLVPQICARVYIYIYIHSPAGEEGFQIYYH